MLIAFGQGLASEVLADPEWDHRAALAQAGLTAKHLLTR